MTKADIIPLRSDTTLAADADPFDRFLAPLGFVAPELDDIQEFHETTRFKSYFDRILGRRIGTYLTDPRAVEETVANRKLYTERETTALPIVAGSATAFAEVLQRRRSCRSFTGEALTAEELSQLLYTVRSTRRARSSVVDTLEIAYRPYPSGGGLYPSEIYLAIRAVDGWAAGIYHYDALAHTLTRVGHLPSVADFRRDMNDNDDLLGTVALTVFVTSLFERTVVKYGRRGYRFALLEAGMIPLMLNLGAAAAGLGALHWGGFVDDQIDAMLGIDGVSETVTACLMIGRIDS